MQIVSIKTMSSAKIIINIIPARDSKHKFAGPSAPGVSDPAPVAPLSLFMFSTPRLPSALIVSGCTSYVVSVSLVFVLSIYHTGCARRDKPEDITTRACRHEAKYTYTCTSQ